MNHRNLFLLFVLFAGTTVVSAPSAARGQERVSPALALARVCVSEAGWECFDTGDGLAIHEVLLRGSSRHNMTYLGYAAAYSSRVVGGREPVTERIRWVRELRSDGSAPPSWPTQVISRTRDGSLRVSPGVPWSRFRDRWMSILRRAEEVVRTLDLDTVGEWGVCETPVHDWGGSMDRARAERLRLVEVQCGNTRNDFYARPSLIRSENESQGG